MCKPPASFSDVQTAWSSYLHIRRSRYNSGDYRLRVLETGERHHSNEQRLHQLLSHTPSLTYSSFTTCPSQARQQGCLMLRHHTRWRYTDDRWSSHSPDDRSVHEYVSPSAPGRSPRRWSRTLSDHPPDHRSPSGWLSQWLICFPGSRVPLRSVHVAICCWRHRLPMTDRIRNQGLKHHHYIAIRKWYIVWDIQKIIQTISIQVLHREKQTYI